MEDIIYLTQQKSLTNREIPIKIKVRLFNDISILKDYYEGSVTAHFCKEGCVNYDKKWSCPPCSNSYLNIEKKYSSACLLCFYTELKHYNDIKNKYLAIKAANVTLKSLVEKSARDLEAYAGGYSLLSGSCRLCKPCQRKLNLPCKNPDKMRYSMEATGLNVQKICNDFLDHTLLWYKNKTLPAYTSTIALVLFNYSLKIDEILNFLK